MSEHFEITVVPTFVFLRVRGSLASLLCVFVTQTAAFSCKLQGKKVLARLEGADTSALGSMVTKYKEAPGPAVRGESSGVTMPTAAAAASRPTVSLDDRLRTLVKCVDLS